MHRPEPAGRTASVRAVFDQPFDQGPVDQPRSSDGAKVGFARVARLEHAPRSDQARPLGVGLCDGRQRARLSSVRDDVHPHDPTASQQPVPFAHREALFIQYDPRADIVKTAHPRADVAGLPEDHLHPQVVVSLECRERPEHAGRPVVRELREDSAHAVGHGGSRPRRHDPDRPPARRHRVAQVHTWSRRQRGDELGKRLGRQGGLVSQEVESGLGHCDALRQVQGLPWRAPEAAGGVRFRA